MPTWKIVTTLGQAEEKFLEPLVLETLGVDIHPRRRQGFLYSREALRLILCDLKLSTEQNSLLLANYHTLEKFPDFTVSLSHAQGVGAAILGDRKKIRSLGIDVELADRVVSPSVVEKITHPDQAKLRNIELWCAKEAVFKCLMNTDLFPQNVRFADINVQQKNWFHAPSSLSGKLELRREGAFVLAMATLSA